jgi:hypothetical protein
MSQTTEFTPLTIKAIEAMPYAELMHQAKTIVVNSAYSLAHHTDLMAILDEIDARVKSRP